MKYELYYKIKNVLSLSVVDKNDFFPMITYKSFIYLGRDLFGKILIMKFLLKIIFLKNQYLINFSRQ